MKKLLTVLLSILMVISIGVVNVAAEDEEVVAPIEEVVEVVEEEVPVEVVEEAPIEVEEIVDELPVDAEEGLYDVDATLRIIYAEGVDKDGKPTNCKLDPNPVTKHMDLNVALRYKLDDFMVGISDPEGYDFYMFGQGYDAKAGTVEKWKLTNFYGEPVRSRFETEECYIVYLKEDAPVEKDFTAHLRIVYSESGWGGIDAIAYDCRLGEKVVVDVDLNELGYYYLTTDLLNNLKYADGEKAGEAFVPEEGYEFAIPTFAKYWWAPTATVSVWTLTEFGKPIRSYRETEDCYIVCTKKEKTIDALTITTYGVPYEGEYDGESHNLFSILPVASDDGVIMYSTDDGKTWSDVVPTAKDVGTYPVRYKAVPATGDEDHKESASFATAAEITPVYLNDDENHEVEIITENKSSDGKHVDFTVELDGEELVEGTDYVVVDNSDVPTKFGDNTLKVEGIGNYDGEFEITYNTGYVQDRYVTWTENKAYQFPVDTEYSSGKDNYVVKTDNGFEATIIEKVENSGWFTWVARKEGGIGKIALNKVTVAANPEVEETEDYYFFIGNVDHFDLPILWNNLGDRKSSATLHVVRDSENDQIIDEYPQNGDYLYDPDTGEDVVLEDGDVVKLVIVPGEDNTIDTYLLLYRAGEDYGVKVTPKKGSKVTLKVAEEDFGTVPAVEKGYKRKYTAVREADGAEIPVTYKDGVYKFASDVLGEFTLTWTDKKITPYTPVVTGVR